MPNNLSDINALLDSLYLELLNLIEQQTACRVSIERISKFVERAIPMHEFINIVYSVMSL